MREMWFVNSFHLQILVIELIFCLRLQPRERFWLRFLPGAAVYVLLPVLIPDIYFAPYLTVGWFTFGFMLFLVLSGLLMGLCFRLNLRQVVFYCCVSHTLQHLVHCCYRMATLIFRLDTTWSQLLQLVFMGIACLVVWYLLRERFGGSATVDLHGGHLAGFAVVSTLIVYVLSYWTTSRETETVGVMAFDAFTCLLLLFILMDIFRIRKAERDQLIMQRMLRQEQEQHAMSKATVEVINRKCHDLRHQIAALRTMNREQREQSIAELEEAVLIYDRFPKSGNADVDIILAEKSLLAEREKIAIRSVVDGTGFAFMAVEDLYSLLGNALDNAIESTRQEENEARRVITLSAARRGSFFAVHVENPCRREPRFLDGLPVTSKQDRDYHGYGVRSMRYLCEKYGGVITTGWAEEVFSVDMLFPLRPDAAEPPAPKN
ncbi:MAG: sensor histidine kinase [Clostridia bacterium]|nr:sensor histidine kinase [Clostridia bacterium]